MLPFLLTQLRRKIWDFAKDIKCFVFRNFSLVICFTCALRNCGKKLVNPFLLFPILFIKLHFLFWDLKHRPSILKYNYIISPLQLRVRVSNRCIKVLIVKYQAIGPIIQNSYPSSIFLILFLFYSYFYIFDSYFIF